MCFVKGFDRVMTLVLTKIFGLSSENKANKPRESIWLKAAGFWGAGWLVLTVRRGKANVASPSVEGALQAPLYVGGKVWPRLDYRTPACAPMRTTKDKILFLCK